jgi:hypothetical protein
MLGNEARALQGPDVGGEHLVAAGDVVRAGARDADLGEDLARGQGRLEVAARARAAIGRLPERVWRPNWVRMSTGSG